MNSTVRDLLDRWLFWLLLAIGVALLALPRFAAHLGVVPA